MIRWFEKYNKISWIITLIGGILIFYISSLTFGGDNNYSLGIIPILYHLLAFFCFGFFFFISLVNGRKNYLNIFIGFLFVFVYAISDEVHQYFVPGRFLSLFDVFIDTVGIIFALMIYIIIILRR